ncbi:MAG: gas vesicle protein GvpN [Odoribacter sp.]|nr:gas vesicle protein GvpN [Odoribacter sp.]
MEQELVTVVTPRPEKGFVETEQVKKLTERALNYIKAGYPVHLSGPTGCGKTTIAMHIANRLGKPVILINGDEEFGTASLVGGESGYRKKRVVDRFVSRVLKEEESMTKQWADERLTSACRYGFTLVYNEFTRSRPEANNALLPVLEERILDLPSGASGESFIKVHPDFSAIFTSNPEEYAGVYRSQDALIDRMITVDIGYYDEETEIEIIKAKSGINGESAERIAKMVRRLRDSGNHEYTPTVRSGIMIAKAMVKSKSEIGDDFFRQVCYDVLSPRIGKGKNGELDAKIVVDDLLKSEGLNKTVISTVKKKRKRVKKGRK